MQCRQRNKDLFSPFDVKITRLTSCIIYSVEKLRKNTPKLENMLAEKNEWDSGMSFHMVDRVASERKYRLSRGPKGRSREASLLLVTSCDVKYRRH